MADYDNPRRNPLLQTEVYFSQSKSAKGCLRIRVLAGSECEKILGVGEMPFLYAIGLLQRAERFLIQVDPEGGLFPRMCLDTIYRKNAQDGRINRWDPWLFRIAVGSRDDQTKFYSKIWRLHMYFQCHIFVSAVGEIAVLRFVEPDFVKLEVRVTLDVGLGEERCHTLTRDDEEGSSYTLSRPLPSEGTRLDNEDYANLVSYPSN